MFSQLMSMILTEDFLFSIIRLPFLHHFLRLSLLRGYTF